MVLDGCGRDPHYDSGYEDGYKEGLRESAYELLAYFDQIDINELDREGLKKVIVGALIILEGK